MTPDELLAAVTTAGLSARCKRDEVLIERCVFCGNERWNLELNASRGVYHCWACDAGGRLDRLLTDVTGQEFEVGVQLDAPAPRTQQQTALDTFAYTPAAEVPSAVQYLGKRGVSADEAAMYGLVVCTEKGHLLEGRICVPMRDFWRPDRVAGWYGRAYTGRQPKYVSTFARRMITGWRGEPDAPYVLVEGPFDGMAVHHLGMNAAVLGGVMLAGVEEWAARVSRRRQIVVLLDADALERAARVYWTCAAVGARVALARLPEGQDPASMDPYDLAALLHTAIHAGGE